jgi:hypothetical protein
MIFMALSRGKRIALIALALVVAGGAIAWRVLNVPEMARIGSGYSAQQTCACLFISHRTLESCMTDLEPLARKMIKVRPGENEVTAFSLGRIASATARYQPGFGCQLIN